MSAAAEPIAHGGRLGAARRRFPDAPAFLDLSTGINPCAYPLPPLPPALWARLPEPEAEAALEACAARRYGAADPAMVVMAPGTQLLIGLLPALLHPAGEVAVLGPTYAEHAAAWRAAGHEVRHADTLAAVEGAALDGAAIGVLCNPNNPDGRRHDAGCVLALAERMAARGGLLVVDEAFADLEPAGLSVVPLLHPDQPGTVVLRSFGKTYGLAGLRLGFAVAGRGLAARLRGPLGPWRVGGPALAVARAALQDDGWLAAQAGRVARDAARLDALLRRAGLGEACGTRLFRLVRTRRAGEVFERLGRAGVLVRAFAGHPEWLRFGLPGDGDWERLERALLDGASVMPTRL